MMNDNMYMNMNQQQQQQQQMALAQQQQQNNALLNKLFEGATVNNGPITGTPIAQVRKNKVEQKVEHYKEPTETEQDRDTIKKLVKNINHDLEEFEPSKTNSEEDDETNHDTDTEKELDNHTKKETSSTYIPNFVKEGILIIIIYVVLSQEYVRNAIGKFITYINPDETGKVQLIGYISYGTILAFVYLFFKHFVV